MCSCNLHTSQILSVIFLGINISVIIIIINRRYRYVFDIIELRFPIRIHSFFMHIHNTYASLLCISSCYFFKLFFVCRFIKLNIRIQRIVLRIFNSLRVRIIYRNFNSIFSGKNLSTFTAVLMLNAD
jgi:hypothetical protein